MVVTADDLTVQRVSPAYQQLLQNRNTTGPPLSEVFSGQDLAQLIKLIKRATSERQPVYSEPINVIPGSDAQEQEWVHTIVPIPDEDGSKINRLFIYSDRPE